MDVITLYPHQVEFFNNCKNAFKSTKSVVGVAATGFGKTATAAAVVASALEKGSPTIFMCHRRELINQTSLTFDRCGIRHALIVAGCKEIDRSVNCWIASVDTLRNRLDIAPPPKLLVIDECHHSMAGSWAKIIQWAKDNGAFILGLTATPVRLDGKGLGGFFDAMVLGPSVAWLIENGYLSSYKAFAPYTPDLSAVRQKMGEFVAADIDAIMDDGVLFGKAVENWQRLADGKRTIAFCPSIALSEKMAHEFTATGIPAAHLDATTHKDDRRDTIMEFADGKIKVLSNVGLFSEGFDLSAIAGRDVPIEAVILYRPTMSLSMHRQQIGRALRPKPYPAVILDHCGNLMRHGMPDDEIEWSLKSKKKKPNEVEMMTCENPGCYAVFKPTRFCPECGFDHTGDPEPKGQSDFKIIDGDLKELTKEDMDKLRMSNRDKKNEMLKNAKTKADLEAIRAMMKYKPGWVWHTATAMGIQT